MSPTLTVFRSRTPAEAGASEPRNAARASPAANFFISVPSPAHPTASVRRGTLSTAVPHPPSRAPGAGDRRAAVPDELDDAGQDRDDDDHHDDEREVALDHRDVAEQVAPDDEDHDPGDAADDVVEDETAVVHAADPGDERRERADDRHEPGDDDGLPAVFFVEPVRALEVLPVQKARALPLKTFGPTMCPIQ